MDPLITNGEIRITDLTKATELRSSDLLVGATHLDGSADITTQAISANVVLDYVLKNGPYTFGLNLSSIGEQSNPTFDRCFVCDINNCHFSIIPSHPAWPQSISQPEAPNCATDSYYSNIGGGTGNVVWGTESTIGGGCYNTVLDSNSVIAGGKENVINCCVSVIGGGASNISCGIYSTIAGGNCNNINQEAATIGGGKLNCITTSESGPFFTYRGAVIAGGTNNALSGCYGFIGGGYCNQVLLNHSVIVAGDCNVIDSKWGFIGAGHANEVTGDCAVLVGGSSNVSQGDGTVIIGGTDNLAAGDYAIIGGGHNNTVNGCHSYIASGEHNIVNGCKSSVIAGDYHLISNRDSFIGGGCCNTTSGVANLVSNGCCHTVSGNYGTITNGFRNTNLADQGTVINGCTNTNSGNYGLISTGCNNNNSGINGTIINGCGNNNTGNYGTIINGVSNNSNSSHTVVLNGCINNVTGNCGFIGTGCNNIASESYTTVINGRDNTANAACSFIAGGHNNCTDAQYNTFLLGSNIKAEKPNFTYVNNLSSQDEIYAVNNVCTTNVCATNCITAGNNICATNTICGDYICGRSCVQTVRSHSSVCASTPLVSSSNAYVGDWLYGNKISATSCVDANCVKSNGLSNVGVLSNVGQLTSTGTICNYGAFNNQGTICNTGYFHNEGTICNITGSIKAENGDFAVTHGRYLSGGEDLLKLFGDYSSVGFYRTPYVANYVGDGVRTRFSDPYFPNINPNNFWISIAGLLQRPGIDFTCNLQEKGTVIFATPPPNGELITIYAQQGMEVGRNIVGFYNPQFVSLVSTNTTDYTIPGDIYNGTDPKGYLVTVAGLVIRPGTDFTVTDALDGINGILHLATIPTIGSKILIYSFKYSTVSVFSSMMTYFSANNWNLPISSISVPSITAMHLIGTSDVKTPYLIADKWSGGTIAGNLTITGNLSTLGTTTFVGSIVSNTSALSVVNYGPAPALFVSQYSTVGDIASFYDADQNVEVLHVGGINSTYPNVGINTSTPNKTLTVNGDLSAKKDLFARNIFTGDGISTGDAVIEIGTGRSGNGNAYLDLHTSVLSDYDLRLSKAAGVDGQASLCTAGNGGLNIATIGTGDLKLVTANTERVNILGSGTAAGNVGIGSASPNERLTVVGSISATGALYTQNPVNNYGIIKLGSNDAAGWHITKETNGSSVPNALGFWTGAVGFGTTRMIILTSGNVGINTLNPTQTLTVNGDILQQSGTLSARNIKPLTTATYDIGQTDNRFNSIYATNYYGTLNVDQIAGVLPTAKGGTGGGTASDGVKNLLAGLGTGTSGYVLKTGGPGSYYWAAETGSSVQVGTRINSTRTATSAAADQVLFEAPSYTTGSNQLRVYVNGVRQTTNDYTETSSASFTLNTKCNAGDYVLAEVDGYYTYPNQASAVVSTATTNIAATNVQDALAELDTEKLAKAGDSMSGDLTMSGAAINLAAGTTTKQPLKFVAGTSLTNAVAGSMEYDGSKFYVTVGSPSVTRKNVATEDYVSNSVAGAIPRGVITMWYGSTSNIPSGWALCDGNNSTPDLRDRFVVGAGGNYSSGSTGGSKDAVVVSHTHTATSTVSDPGHSHGFSGVSHSHGVNDPGHTHSYVTRATTSIQDGDDTPCWYGTANASTGSSTTGITVKEETAGGTVANANASVSVSTAVASNGVDGTGKNMPPHHALCFIMKT
jgi:hypothetical protein